MDQTNILTPMHLEAPTPYNIKQDPSAECTIYSVPSTSSSLSADECTPFKFKPIVIPQTSKTFRGPFFSPFCRAYSPSLQNFDINESEFLFFLDGLNEAFVAAPPFQIASNVGTVMSFAPLPSIRYTEMGLALGAGLVSTATSWLRTKSYGKTANEEMFLPKGLRCRVLKTKKMMPHVGHAAEKLELPPLDSLEWNDDDIGGNNDPRIRRVLALGDHVAPLNFDGLPPPEPFESWLKRWGSSSAQKQDAKMQKKLLKKRMKLVEEYRKKMEEVESEMRKGEQEVAKIERQKDIEVAKAKKKIGEKAHNPKKRARIEAVLSEQLEKLDDNMNKVVAKIDERVAKKTENCQPPKFSSITMAIDTPFTDSVSKISPEVAPLVKFTIFSKFLPELRDIVWKFAIPHARVIKLIYRRDGLGYKYEISSGPYNPPLLHTNRESRNVGLKFYQSTFSALTRPTIYFNYASDWLYAQLNMLYHFQNFTRGHSRRFHFIKSDELLFRRLMLSTASPWSLVNWTKCAGLFPNLETLEIGLRYGRVNELDKVAFEQKLREERAKWGPGQAETQVVYRTLKFVQEFPKLVSRGA